MTLDESRWIGLLKLINQKLCTPFIGSGAANQWLPTGTELAENWADEFKYPMKDKDDLSKLAQFLVIMNEGDDLFPKILLSDKLKNLIVPNFDLPQNENSPYAILAELPFPIYITTNYDNIMEKALRDKRRKPVSEFCRWNNYAELRGIPSIFSDKAESYIPSEEQPLVYHLHGHMDYPQSMILTESDYIDFILSMGNDFALLDMKKKSKMFPSEIMKALATTSLLFIGYSLRDVNFRIMFRNIVNHVGERSTYRNVAVLKGPPSDLPENLQTETRDYLDKYVNKMFKTNVYWGDNHEFFMDLRSRWDTFRASIK
jgi:hypothetical protein